MDGHSLLYLIVVFSVALIGGLWGLVGRLSAESLHLALALAAGFFLGATFLHLIPEAFQGVAEHKAISIGALILLGYLGIYVIEKGVIPFALGARMGDGHRVVALTAFLGLCVHSVAEGPALAYAALEGIDHTLLISISAHKFAAAMALSSLFVLANFNKFLNVSLIVLFSLMTPIGGFVGVSVAEELHDGHRAITALAAGIFLYVATADILPEVMHSKASIGWKLLLLTGGVAFLWVLAH